MPDKTIEHGTRKGAVHHRNEGTVPCLPCCDAEGDYHQRWRIRSGKKKSLSVPLDSARRILAGENAAVVLAETFGPLTVDAVRQYGLPGDQEEASRG